MKNLCLKPRAVIDFGSLPFHVGISDSPNNIGFPNLSPFATGIIKQINLVVQLFDPGVQKYLEDAYRKGSMIGTPMSENGIGRAYANDFLTFVHDSIPSEKIRGKRILEIGCGTGYLLHRLKELGGDVLGIEPGAQGQAGKQNYGVDIIRDMFPVEYLMSTPPFDLILHFAVLEHVPDPFYFLESHHKCLSDSGQIILAAPDCSEYIQKADLSMFVHEHWSYFSPSSLKAVLQKAGFKVLNLKKSGFGGSLYAAAIKANGVPETSISQNDDEAIEFDVLVKKNIRSTRDFFEDAFLFNKTIGVFCPQRILNLLHLVKAKNPLRFFDDDPSLHDRYYPPFDIPIENRAQLMARPVDALIIMSRTFGNKIKGELCEKEDSGQRTILLPDDLLNYEKLK